MRTLSIQTPKETLIALVERLHEQKMKEGYVPPNNYIYKERLWYLYESLSPEAQDSLPTYVLKTLLNIAPFTRKTPEETVQRVVHIIEKFRSRNEEVREMSLTALVLAHRHFSNASDRIEELLRKWTYTPTETKNIYSSLLLVYMTQVGTEKAEEWFDSKIGTLVYHDVLLDNNPNLQPLKKDEVIYGMLIKGFSAEKKFDKALAKYKELLASGMCRYPERSLNRLMYGLAKGGRVEDAVRLFYRSKKAGVKPDRLTFETLLMSIYKIQAKTQDVPTVAELAELSGRVENQQEDETLFQASTSVSRRETLSTEINDQPARKYRKTRYSDMYASSLKPRDNLTSSTVPQFSHCTYDIHELADFSVLQSDVEVDFNHRSLTINIFRDMISHRFLPDLPTFNIFLAAYLQKQEFRIVLELYNLMKETLDVPHDAATYSIVLKALVRLQKLDEAIELIQASEEDFIEPDMVLYASIMDAYGRTGKYDLALRYWDKIMEAGFQPSELALQILLHIQCMR